MVTQYLNALETIVSLTTPLVIFALALRRLILSRSFNRVIYAIMAGLAAVTVVGLLDTTAVPGMFRKAAPIYALTCLALWLLVTTLGPSTRGLRTYR